MKRKENEASNNPVIALYVNHLGSLNVIKKPKSTNSLLFLLVSHCLMRLLDRPELP